MKYMSYNFYVSKPRPFQKLYPFSKTPGFQNPVLSKTPLISENPGFQNPVHFQIPRYKIPCFFKTSVFLKFHSKVRLFLSNPGVFIKAVFSTKLRVV